jgi:hypothetical protein
MAFKVTIKVQRVGAPTIFGAVDETKLEVTRGTRDEAFAAAIATLFQMGGKSLQAYMNKMITIWQGLIPLLRLFREDKPDEDVEKTVDIHQI